MTLQQLIELVAGKKRIQEVEKLHNALKKSDTEEKLKLAVVLHAIDSIEII